MADSYRNAVTIVCGNVTGEAQLLGDDRFVSFCFRRGVYYV